MADAPFSLGIVLLNYLGWKDTLACVDSLLKSERPWFRLVICDNASPDDSLARLRSGLLERLDAIEALQQRWWPENTHTTSLLITKWSEIKHDLAAQPSAFITVIDNESNGGFAKGNNTALGLLECDERVTHFWLLNNDTEVLPTTVGEIQKSTIGRPDVDLWGATVLYYHSPEQVQALGGGSMNWLTAESRHIGAFTSISGVNDSSVQVENVEQQMDYVLGASMLATRRWVKTVGLLSEDYFLFYEEADWALRGKRAGLKTGYAPNVRLLHKEGASIGTAPSGGSPFSIYHLTRSRLIFSRIYLPRTHIPIIGLNVLYKSLKHILKGEYKQGRAGVSGALDGWRR